MPFCVGYRIPTSEADFVTPYTDVAECQSRADAELLRERLQREFRGAEVRIAFTLTSTLSGSASLSLTHNR